MQIFVRFYYIVFFYFVKTLFLSLKIFLIKERLAIRIFAYSKSFSYINDDIYFSKTIFHHVKKGKYFLTFYVNYYIIKLEQLIKEYMVNILSLPHRRNFMNTLSILICVLICIVVSIFILFYNP